MLISMLSIPGWGSASMNYYISAVWHRGDQLVVLLRCSGRSGCFDSSLKFLCIVGSDVSHLPLVRGSSQAHLMANQAQYHHGQQPIFGSCGPVPSSAGERNQHLFKACRQQLQDGFCLIKIEFSISCHGGLSASRTVCHVRKKQCFLCVMF